jgi:hypothetical protein
VESPEPQLQADSTSHYTTIYEARKRNQFEICARKYKFMIQYIIATFHMKKLRHRKADIQ